MIKIDSLIPSGNIVFIGIDSNEGIHLNLNTEFDSFTHWFYFKVILDRITKNSLKFFIDNALQSPFAEGWKNYTPFTSSDGNNWQRIENGNILGSAYNFEIDIYYNEFFVAWYPPYPLDKYYCWLKQISISSLFQVFQEKSKPDYIIAGNKSKPTIIIIARQHSGETMASYVIEGFVNACAQQIDRFKKLLEDYSVIIFPLFNKGGVEKGFHRVNAVGEDLNRCWGSDKVDEIKFVKNILSSCSSIHFIIDIHGDEVSKFNYVYYDQKSGNSFQRNFLNSLNSGSPKIIFLPKQKFIKRFLKQLIRKRKILRETGLTLSDFGRKKYRAITFTLEVSAKTTSENNCQQIGYNIFNSIVEQ
jgi:hypothetical protein